MRRPLFAMFALILASLACQAPAETITKGLITCNYAGLYVLSGGHTYYCTCPATGNEQNISLENLKSYDENRLYRETCGLTAPLPQPQPSATPTEALAAPPTEPPVAPAPLNPYLAGTFTTCDNVARYVNFTIAEDAPPYDPAATKVLFNGQPATCTPAASNSKVLTCIYPPAPYGPPAIIEVFIGEEKVNEFNFDGGAICEPAPLPSGNESENPPAPVATEPPADTGD